MRLLLERARYNKKFCLLVPLKNIEYQTVTIPNFCSLLSNGIINVGSSLFADRDLFSNQVIFFKIWNVNSNKIIVNGISTRIITNIRNYNSFSLAGLFNDLSIRIDNDRMTIKLIIRVSISGATSKSHIN